jgi:YebC/PmpR family DNA-binding regulatory protein
MPNDNIERAVKKGTGELEGGALEELSYEGYAPGGVALIVNCLTDNRNRTAANVRSYFTKYNGNLAGSGAVAWQFHRKSVFTVSGIEEEALLEVLLEADVEAEDMAVEDGIGQITAPPDAFGSIADALEAAGVKVEDSGVRLVPENNTPVTESSTAKQILRLIDALEDDDDVQEVVANFEMSDELMEQVSEDS